MTAEGWGRGGPPGPWTAPEVKWPPAALERSRAARCGPSSSRSPPPPWQPPPSARGMERGSEGGPRPECGVSGSVAATATPPGAQITRSLSVPTLGPRHPRPRPLKLTATLPASSHPSHPLLVFLLGEMLMCQPPVNCVAVRLQKRCAEFLVQRMRVSAL